MSRHNSTGSFPAFFSVVQPSLGAALQWTPALGSLELDSLINAYIPGPAPIQEKRAQAAMEFFEHAQLTGASYKFFEVYSFTPMDSPASSAAMYDSGYGSSFNASPVASDLSPWIQPAACFTPASTASSSGAQSRSPKKAASAPRSRTQTDFSDHPGMRIITRDGRDVTTSASRGCKTKEQRDHAHLMRIIKACDSCKRKKIRCDPSHKKRSSSQASCSQSEPKVAKKARVAIPEQPPPLDFGTFNPEFPLENEWFDFDAAATTFNSHAFAENESDLWQQFLPINTALGSDINFYSGSAHSFSTSNRSSPASPSQAFTPLTPATSSAADIPHDVSRPEPTLPYLTDGLSRGSNYIDFNLYSPASDSWDEELDMTVRPSTHTARKESSSRPLSSPAPMAQSSSSTTGHEATIVVDSLYRRRHTGDAEPAYSQSPLTTDCCTHGSNGSRISTTRASTSDQQATSVGRYLSSTTFSEVASASSSLTTSVNYSLRLTRTADDADTSTLKTVVGSGTSQNRPTASAFEREGVRRLAATTSVAEGYYVQSIRTSLSPLATRLSGVGGDVGHVADGSEYRITSYPALTRASSSASSNESSNGLSRSSTRHLCSGGGKATSEAATKVSKARQLSPSFGLDGEKILLNSQSSRIPGGMPLVKERATTSRLPYPQLNVGSVDATFGSRTESLGGRNDQQTSPRLLIGVILVAMIHWWVPARRSGHCTDNLTVPGLVAALNLALFILLVTCCLHSLTDVSRLRDCVVLLALQQGASHLLGTSRSSAPPASNLGSAAGRVIPTGLFRHAVDVFRCRLATPLRTRLGRIGTAMR